MNMHIYREKLTKLEQKIDVAIEICKKYNDNDHIHQLQAIKHSIQTDNFQLIVVGEFSVGKSTLVNALIGDNVLPSDPNPTTIMLNVIKNGDKEAKYKIHYKDGREISVDRDEFERMVAKNESDKVTKDEIIKDYYNEEEKNFSIKNAEIFVENNFGKMGIDIVDTPGMNDINTAREEVTLNYIPKSDAAIVVCSAIHPLSKSEMDFIKSQLVDQQITKLFVAVNYSDTLRTETERQSMFELFEEKLKEIVPKERIFLSYCLSDLFNRRVFLDSEGQTMNVKTELKMQANDVFGATVGAGAVAAVGTIAMTALGFGALGPIITMAVLPSLRNSFLKEELHTSKEKVTPAIHQEINNHIEKMKKVVDSNVYERVDLLVNSIKTNYNNYLYDYQCHIERCVLQKQQQENRIQDMINGLTDNCTVIDKVLIQTRQL